MGLPATGESADAILARLDAMQASDVDWHRGRAFSLAYHAGDDVLDLAKAAYAKFLSSNALNVGAFPSLRTLQSEVVAMVTDLLHGGPQAAGFMTTGGTESILLAVKAARGRGRERGVTAPEMVLHKTADAGVAEGAESFGLTGM